MSWQTRTVGTVTTVAESCVFCDIITGDADKPKRYEPLGLTSVAFEPLGPVTPGHTLIVPRLHVVDATQDAWVAGNVMLSAALYAKRFPAANIITSIGSAATQTIFHLHLHVVPRRPGDGLTLPWTGQEVDR